MAKTLTVYLAADLRNFNRNMDDAERRAKGLGGTMSGMLGPALIGAAAAAGTFAVALGVDGVKAAIEDEAAAAKLAKTLENLGLAHDTAPVEAYIDSMQRSLGIADSELRPAYDRLVRSIGNTEEANKALALSADIAAGTGKSLQAVVEALSRGYDGSTTSLSRLGAGLDTAILRTGDMQAITQRLADTFGGQATTQSQTFQGQLNRLSVAADELKEAFGVGLLGAIDDANGQTQSLTDSMAELEPLLKRIGGFIGETASDYLTLADAIQDAASASEDFIDGLGPLKFLVDAAASTFYQFLNPVSYTVDVFTAADKAARGMTSGTVLAALGARNVGTAASSATPSVQGLTDAVDDSGAEASESAVRYLSLAEAIDAVGGGTFNYRKEISGATDDARDLAIELNYNAYVTRVNEAAAAAAAAATGRQGSAASSAAGSTEKLTAAEKALTKAYEAQSLQFEDTKASLQQHIMDLETAGQRAKDYADSIRDGLTAGLDLAAAYSGQFTKEGEKTGISLLEGFNRQVAQVEWFGNVLAAMKAQGADAAFIQEVAGLGPGIGGPLGEQLINDGLVPTMSDKWVNVQNKISELGVQLVPEFLNQGVADAQALVNGMAQQLAMEGGRLTKIGKEIGKPVGASFKAQILEDVAEAVRAVEASATAARAERVAQASAQQARITEQAVAQAVASLVAKSDARTGRPNPAAPARPVWVLG